IGQHISVVRSALTPKEVTAEILPSTLKGGWRGELWNRRKDGTDFLVLLTTAAVTDDAGKLDATVGVVRDITEERRFEGELGRAKEEAERANRAKSEFRATISPEIRTPMNGVIGMTSLLLDTELDETQRDYADTVRKSADALLGIINDILDFSRIEAGKMSISATPFDLAQVIGDVNGILSPKASSLGLLLSMHYPPELPRRFVGDAGRVRQVLMNLVSNALKFTPTGEVKVLVECAWRDAESAEMRLSVRDTGVGIPEDKLDLIFEKFSQVDSSNTRRYGGTGLGLAIAKELVDLMHGKIGVRSRMGHGSTFWFSLQLRLDLTEESPRAPTWPAGPRPGGLEPWPGVLVAEDNVVNQKVAAGMLQRLGFTTDVAADGSDALEKWVAGQHEVVFMDCHMPEMGGYEAAAEIRRREGGRRRATIIALTADARDGTRERCIQAGMDDYIVKPVKLDDLRQALENRPPAEK